MSDKPDEPIAGWKLTTSGAALFGLLAVVILARASTAVIGLVAVAASWVGVPTFFVGLVRLVKAALRKRRA